MGKDNYLIKEVNIDDVLLNVENPRFEKVDSQEAAMEIMIKEFEVKIYNLAKHIVENGLNPTELSAVIKLDNGKYVTLDGNRRFTTLKILHNPNLLSGKFEKLKSKIIKLDRTNIPTTINVIEFVDEEEANLWIKLKHTGENDGVGVVGWNSIQQARFDNEKYPLSVQLLKYMEINNLLDIYLSKKIKDLKITNLERLLTDPDVRNILSITRVKNELHFPIANKETGDILNNFLSELFLEDFTVNTIRFKADRTKFMNDFKDKYGLTEDVILDLKKRETVTVNDKDKPKKNNDQIKDNDKPDNDTNVKPDSNPKTPKVTEKPSTKERRFLIPDDFNLSINNKKINDIYKELKEISVIDYPNVIGASFRVFLELSLDYYIDEVGVSLGNNDNLNNKLNKVKSDINAKLDLNKSEFKNINRAISSNDNIISINVLHGYIHSTVAQASADGLKTTWNNYERFIELLYKVINDLSLANA